MAIADEEQEGVVGVEHQRLPHVGAEGFVHRRRRRRGLCALLVDVDEGLVDHLGDEQFLSALPGVEHAGAIGDIRNEDVGRAEGGDDLLRLDFPLDGEAGQGNGHVCQARLAPPLEQCVGREAGFESGQAVGRLRQEHEHLEIPAAVGERQQLEALGRGQLERLGLMHHRHRRLAAVGPVERRRVRAGGEELPRPRSLERDGIGQDEPRVGLERVGEDLPDLPARPCGHPGVDRGGLPCGTADEIGVVEGTPESLTEETDEVGVPGDPLLAPQAVGHGEFVRPLPLIVEASQIPCGGDRLGVGQMEHRLQLREGLAPRSGRSHRERGVDGERGEDATAARRVGGLPVELDREPIAASGRRLDVLRPFHRWTGIPGGRIEERNPLRAGDLLRDQGRDGGGEDQPEDSQSHRTAAGGWEAPEPRDWMGAVSSSPETRGSERGLSCG